MAPRTSLPVTLLFMVLLTAALLPLHAAASGTGMLSVKGRILAMEGDLSDALVVVEVDGTTCSRARLDRQGGFELTVPPGVCARLRFSKPGYLNKEVVLDTRHADARGRGDRRVRFDVRLEPQRRHPGHRYAAPAGRISYLKGSGLQQVRRQQRYEPVPPVGPADLRP